MEPRSRAHRHRLAVDRSTCIDLAGHHDLTRTGQGCGIRGRLHRSMFGITKAHSNGRQSNENRESERHKYQR